MLSLKLLQLLFFLVLCMSVCSAIKITNDLEGRVKVLTNGRIQNPVSKEDRRRSGERILEHIKAQALNSSSSNVTTGKSPTIVGGYNAGDDTAAYMAFIDIYTADGYGRVCSGSVISNDRVLTAAHCFKDYYGNVNNVQNIFVWLRVKDFKQFQNTNYPYVYDAVAAHIDKRYSTAQKNYDVAVVTIGGYFATSQKIAHLARRTLRKTQWAFASGYGIITEEQVAFPRFLQEVRLKIRKFKRCYDREDIILRRILDPKSMICASAGNFRKGGQDTCSGDSGGPLFKRSMGMTIYAITSFGKGCARQRTGAWYMKIAFFRKRIQQHIKSADELHMINDNYWYRIL